MKKEQSDKNRENSLIVFTRHRVYGMEAKIRST